MFIIKFGRLFLYVLNIIIIIVVINIIPIITIILDNKISLFFGPRTLIGEISSTIYAEFRHVYRIFLSGRFSKIQRTVFVQNSTWRTNETDSNLPLKCRGVWLSAVIGFRYIPLQFPTIVCQDTSGPLALVSLFHGQNILVKSFTVFVTDFAEILWEKNPWPRTSISEQTSLQNTRPPSWA